MKHINLILAFLCGAGLVIAIQLNSQADITTPEVVNLGTYTVTAYCPKSCCCGKFANGITASGHKIQPGDKFVAAPPEIPFGTLLVIPGYNNGLPVPVLDRGGVIKGNKLDVYFDTHQAALSWGVQFLEVKKCEK